MRLLVSWVRDFVDVTASPEEIAEKLALRGFEVGSVEAVDAGSDAKDAVIDFDVKPNRPDCLSVLGLAREIATAYDLPLRPFPPEPRLGATAAQPSAASVSGTTQPGAPPVQSGTPQGLKVTIEDEELCPRYAAAVAEVTASGSPAWLVERLKAAAVRPISPIVDITNYVLMELGHPLHAFDLSKLAGPELRIRRAAPGERITTLDGIDRALDPEMLVIADAKRPQAIAGVMGGAGSEVSAGTRAVVFESACFKPTSVRRTSKRLGLKTEASSRFERGADIGAPVIALQRAVALMQQIGAGRLTGPIADVYPGPQGRSTVHLRRNRLAQLLGLNVPDADVRRILRSLELHVTDSVDGWEVVPPSFRVDLRREVDLIEEVGRHYGLDKLEPAFPPATSAAPAPDPRVPRDQLVRRVLTAAGFSEAVTFGFLEANVARAFARDDDAGSLVDIANPLSAKFSTLRASLIPGLVDSIAHNRRHGRRDVALFEIGARFSSSTGETRGVGVGWTGAPLPEHWSGGTREVDLFDLTGIMEHLCAVLGVPVRFTPATLPFLVPGQTSSVVSGAELVGLAGLVVPALVEERGAPRQDKIFVAELNLDRLASLREEAVHQLRPLPRFPSVVRDLSIVVSDTLPAEIIRGTILSAGAECQAPLAGVTFFDRYKGKGLSDETVSLSVHLTFRASDRTLTDAEVQQSVETILVALGREHGAVQR